MLFLHIMSITKTKAETLEQLRASDIHPHSHHPLPNSEMPPLLKQCSHRFSHLVACMLS